MACRENPKTMQCCMHIDTKLTKTEGAITIITEICCHCGETKEHRVITGDKKHGKFLPEGKT